MSDAAPCDESVRVADEQHPHALAEQTMGRVAKDKAAPGTRDGVRKRSPPVASETLELDGAPELCDSGSPDGGGAAIEHVQDGVADP